jgi:ABC-type phosphate transport system auxiliary subunit
MDTRDTLKSVFRFFLRNRKTGATRLIQRIAKQNDVWVLVSNQMQEKDFGDKGVSIHRINELDGLEKRPILVDNQTMMKIFGEFSDEKTELEKQIKELENLVDNIHTQISVFKRDIYAKRP